LALPNGTILDSYSVHSLTRIVDDSFNNLDNLTANVSNYWQGVGDSLLQDYKRGLNNSGYTYNDYTASFFRGEVNNVLRIEYGVNDISSLSALGFQQYIQPPGQQFNSVLNGFSKLTEFFANQVKSFIRLNQAVTNIDMSTSKIQITLAPNQNNTAEKGYFADYVISTIPLGFVKENLATLFTPPMMRLSYAKGRSIKRLGVGTVNKIIIVYPTQLFKNGEKGLAVFWFGDNPNLDSKYNLKVNFYHICFNFLLAINYFLQLKIKGNKFYQGFGDFFVSEKTPMQLETFLAGDDADFSETLSPTTLLNIINDILSTAFPNLNLPAGIQVIRYA
jgi:hypothetical protein